jgi:hypothetical protein
MHHNALLEKELMEHGNKPTIFLLLQPKGTRETKIELVTIV